MFYKKHMQLILAEEELFWKRISKWSVLSYLIKHSPMLANQVIEFLVSLNSVNNTPNL